LLGGLLRRPGDLAGMMMLAKRSASGFKTLRQVAPLASLLLLLDAAELPKATDRI